MDKPDSLDISLFSADRVHDPFLMPWPVPGNPAALLPFHNYAEWQTFIDVRGLHPAIPQIVSGKFRRAQNLYLLAWIDFGLLKAGELVAFGACQGTCRLSHAAKGCLSVACEAIVTTDSRSGLRVTAPTGVQSRVQRDQRAGLRSRARTYTS